MCATRTFLLLAAFPASVANAQVLPQQQMSQAAQTAAVSDGGRAQRFNVPAGARVSGAQYPRQPMPLQTPHEHPPQTVPKGPIRAMRTASPPTPVHQIPVHQIDGQRPKIGRQPALGLQPVSLLRLGMPHGNVAGGLHAGSDLTPAPSNLLGDPPPPIDIWTNTAFGSALSSDTDGEEDSEASAGNVVFFTGNWFAAYSSDGGNTFHKVDPTTVFPSADGGFCCDQIVLYLPQVDRFVWLIQYKQNSSNENRYRLAIAAPDDITKSAGTAWTYWDLTSATFGLSKVWMDFPELAAGTHSLYINANIIGDPKGTQHVVVRIPVANLASLTPHTLGGDYIIWKENHNSNFAMVQNSPSRAPTNAEYWAAHESSSQIRVFAWEEGSSSFSSRVLDIASWPFADHSSTTPDGANWLSALHTDMRGANDGNNLWLAWPVGRDDPEFVKDTKPAQVIPQPHIKVVRLSLPYMTVAEEQYIWDPDVAYSYPTLAANSSRQIGIACAWGGNKYYANVAVGMLNKTSGEPFAPYLQSAAFSSIGKPWWGDYITVREHYPDTERFSVGAFAIVKTSTGFKNQPHFIVFGQGVPKEAPFRPR